MFEKFGQAAEQVATSVSRRQFLGRLGGAALAAAAAVGGLLAIPDVAQAQGGVCGPQSFVTCRGRPFNSPCIVPRFLQGHCRAYSGGTCYCQ
jgi:hypothetical protein